MQGKPPKRPDMLVLKPKTAEVVPPPPPKHRPVVTNPHPIIPGHRWPTPVPSSTFRSLLLGGLVDVKSHWEHTCRVLHEKTVLAVTNDMLTLNQYRWVGQDVMLLPCRKPDCARGC